METSSKRPFVLKNILLSLESNINSRLDLFQVLLISLVPAICSIAYQGGGVAHPEIYNYLPRYLSDTPLPAILFDSKVLDMDMYQARELSYLFDYIDCKFIEFSTRLGYPHFLSITTYLFLLVIGLLIWHFSVKIIHLSSITGTALLLLYWTSPSIFLAGNYFRSSKNGVALTGALLFILLYKFLNTNELASRKGLSKSLWLAFFGISLAATLFDRQGFYFVAMAIFFILTWNFRFPDQKNMILLSAFGASLVVSLLYNYWLAPLVTETLNRYQPNFSYQQIPWQNFFSNPVGYFLAGASLYADTLRFMLGNIPLEIIVVGFIIVIAEIIRRVTKEWQNSKTISKATFVSMVLLLTSTGLLIGLDFLMVLRHPPLLWPDVRRVYYWIPQAVILYLTIAYCLSALRSLPFSHKSILTILLLVAVLGNVMAIPHHKAYLLEGHLKRHYEFTPRLLDALNNIKNTEYQASSDILQNPIYQYFQNSMLR